MFTGDGRELLATEVKSKDPPQAIAIDVKGVRLLRITVTSEFFFNDQVDIADAKVNK